MPDYFMPIPSESQDAYWEHKAKSPQNAGLVFERFAPRWEDRADTLKEKGLQATREASQKADKELLAAWNARWARLTQGALAFSLQTDWRLIAGLGKKSSLEVGFTFHRYGFPYLPGSSLKGLARAAALLDVGEKLGEATLQTLHKQVVPEKDRDKVGLLGALESVLAHPEEEKFLKELTACQRSPSDAVESLAKTFRIVFGTTEHAGHVIFFDAIPSARGLPILELDIMNPHYPDYYKETGQAHPSTPPANWQNPIPVKFLTVAPGTEFRFAVGWRKTPVDSTPLESLTEKAQKEWSWFKGATTPASTTTPNPVLEQARNWLESGLRDLGAGGKTNAGYGYFTDQSTNSPTPRAQERTALAPPSLPTGYERGVVREFATPDRPRYGFITRSNGANLFVHRNTLRPGVETLQAGQRVIFKVGKGDKGSPQAMDVHPE